MHTFNDDIQKQQGSGPPTKLVVILALFLFVLFSLYVL